MSKIHWRPIDKFPLYWVSSDGRVRTFKRRQRELRPSIDKGYNKIALYRGDDKSMHTRWVHRLVAAAFRKRAAGMNEVNHKDLNKLNNNHWNLEWTDHLGNMKHCHKNLDMNYASGSRHGMAKLTESEVELIRFLYSKGNTSYPKLSKMFGISISTAQRTVTKQTWKTL